MDIDCVAEFFFSMYQMFETNIRREMYCKNHIYVCLRSVSIFCHTKISEHLGSNTFVKVVSAFCCISRAKMLKSTTNLSISAKIKKKIPD